MSTNSSPDYSCNRNNKHVEVSLRNVYHCIANSESERVCYGAKQFTTPSKTRAFLHSSIWSPGSGQSIQYCGKRSRDRKRAECWEKAQDSLDLEGDTELKLKDRSWLKGVVGEGPRKACNFCFTRTSSRGLSIDSSQIHFFKKSIFFISCKKKFWTLNCRFWGPGYLDYEVCEQSTVWRQHQLTHFRPARRQGAFATQNHESINSQLLFVKA